MINDHLLSDPGIPGLLGKLGYVADFCIILGAFWQYTIDIEGPLRLELSQIEGKMVTVLG